MKRNHTKIDEPDTDDDEHTDNEHTAILSNILCNVNPHVVCVDHTLMQLYREADLEDFTHEIDNQPAICDQYQSGRCWMFARLYPLRHAMINKYKLSNKFDFSTSWLYFHDKYEKLVCAFRQISQYRDQPLRSPVMRSINYDDGGYCDGLYNIVNKYGIVPKSAYGESYHTKDTDHLDDILHMFVQRYKHKIRAAPDEEQEEIIGRATEDSYKLLCSMLGEPPKTFNFSYHGTDGISKSHEVKHDKFKRRYLKHTSYTPKSFYEYVCKASKKSLLPAFCLINDTSPDREYDTLYHGYHVKRNVYEAVPRKMLNISMTDMLDYIRKSIMEGVPVPVECDISTCNHSSSGLLIDGLYKYGAILPVLGETLSKHEELRHSLTSINHVVCVVGYNSVSGTWKIANSWGSTHGKTGYLIADTAWMKKYVYSATVVRRLLSDSHRDILDGEPAGEYGYDDMWD